MKRKRESSAVAERRTSIEDLPNEILGAIFGFVVPEGRDGLRLVLRSACKRWNVVASKREYDVPARDRVIDECACRGDSTTHCHVYFWDGCPRRSHLTPYDLFVDAAHLGYAELCDLAASWAPRACERAAHKSIMHFAWAANERMFRCMMKHSPTLPESEIEWAHMVFGGERRK